MSQPMSIKISRIFNVTSNYCGKIKNPLKARNLKFGQSCWIRMMETRDKLLFGDVKGIPFLLIQNLKDSYLSRSKIPWDNCLRRDNTLGMYNLIANPKATCISSIMPVTSLSELIIRISQDRNGQIKFGNEIIRGDDVRMTRMWW